MSNLDVFQYKKHIWHIKVNLVFFSSFLPFYYKSLILEDCSNRNKRLKLSILVSWSNFSTNSNSNLSLASVIILLILKYFLTSGSEISKRGLLMTFDLSLGRQIMKLKINSFLRYIAFFIQIYSSVFSINLNVPIIHKENDHLFVILLIIPFSYNLFGSFLWISLVNIVIWIIFESLMSKVETWRDILFTLSFWEYF